MVNGEQLVVIAAGGDLVAFALPPTPPAKPPSRSSR
jgi:hypothetical protein